MRILLVEHEETISEPLAEHLERDGFEPEVAATLAEARAALGREMPDLILLDVMLPDGDGRAPGPSEPPAATRARAPGVGWSRPWEGSSSEPRAGPTRPS